MNHALRVPDLEFKLLRGPSNDQILIGILATSKNVELIGLIQLGGISLLANIRSFRLAGFFCLKSLEPCMSWRKQRAQDLVCPLSYLNLMLNSWGIILEMFRLLPYLINYRGNFLKLTKVSIEYLKAFSLKRLILRQT